MSPTTAHMAKARTLREGGWTYPEIARLLNDEGVRVHWQTVRRWVDEQEAERHREYQRRWMAEYRRRLRVEPEPDPLRDPVVLARRLREAGQPVAGIVRVLRVVFGEKWTRGRVLGVLRDEP